MEDIAQFDRRVGGTRADESRVVPCVGGFFRDDLEVGSRLVGFFAQGGGGSDDLRSHLE